MGRFICLFLVTCLHLNALAYHVEELSLQDFSYKTVLSQDADRLIIPGSMLKPFTYLYLNQQGLITDEKIFCPGWKKHPHKKIGRFCWLKTGHRWLGPSEALAHSCNAYFYHFLPQIDRSAYLSWLGDKYLGKSLRVNNHPSQILGDNLAQGLSLRDLNHGYLRLLKNTRFKKLDLNLWLGLEKTLTQGTLAFLNKSISDQGIMLHAAKTGTSYLNNKLRSGSIWLFFSMVETRKMYSLVVSKRKTRSKEVAGKSLLPLLKIWQKKL